MTPERFIRGNTTVAVPALVPEIRLYLSTEVTPLWHATADLLDDAGIEPPFWAFAWPGGQAVARYILDHPELVAGRSVLDFASGSGIAAIAAARAGAASVTASDTDPLAVAAIGMNAVLNDVTVEACAEDLTATASRSDWDVAIAGDVFYDRAMAAAVAPFLFDLAGRGVEVLAGDPGRTYLPAAGLCRVAAYDVPTSLELEAGERLSTTIWRIGGVSLP